MPGGYGCCPGYGMGYCCGGGLGIIWIIIVIFIVFALFGCGNRGLFGCR